MTDRYSRQSFLGENAKRNIENCIVGVAGLGGGGSHVVQQLVHIGFQEYVLFDEDVTEESNLNRLVGATSIDAIARTPKLHIAKTMVLGLQPKAKIRGYATKWQAHPELLRECHIVFGCVDGYQQRAELEIACRRYLCHYIDIGMDVHGADIPVISGQVILSSPDGPCMRCMSFLTDEKLVKEAGHYGDAGPNPQVVWSNGVLASLAVGIAVDLITDWTRARSRYRYVTFNGNTSRVADSITLKNLEGKVCPHFDSDSVGDVALRKL